MLAPPPAPRRAALFVAPLALAATALGSCVVPYDTADSRANAALFEALRPSVPPAYAGLTERIGAIHVHTELSHDSTGTIEEVAAAAREAGLDFVFTTEHPSPRLAEGFRGERDGVQFFPGAELRFGGGSLLVLDSTDFSDVKGRPLADVARDVRAKGGLAVPGHLEEFDPAVDLSHADAIGVFNLHAAVKEEGAGALAPQMIFTHLFYRGDLSWLPLVRVRNENLKAWDVASRPGIAECDAHRNVSFLGIRLDPYRKSLGFCRNHFFARDGSGEELKAAIREGRGFMSFDAIADATGALFWLEDGRGESLPLGAEAPFRKGLTLRAELPAPGTVRLVRDGEPHFLAEGSSFEYAIETSGSYRFEVFLPVFGRATPWILTNPIRVR